MARKPYIGVTGFTTREQVDAALAAFPECGRQLMVGVLASGKTLAGGELNPRSPHRDKIAKVFSDDPRCLNLVHYFAKNTPDVARLLDCAMGYGGPLCHGVQLNCLTLPTPAELARFRVAYPAARLVLQWRLAGSPRMEAQALQPYVPHVTDILVDASGDRGLPVQAHRARLFLEEVMRQGLANEGLGLGVAGGLSAITLPDIADLVREYDISFDAEGKLRDQEDRLDPVEVADYLRVSAGLVRR